MSNFFTSDKIYKERISICRSCVYYFKPSGQCKRCLCFMKIKSRIANQECPEKFWISTKEVEPRTEIPKEIVQEVLSVWDDLKTGRAKNQEAKKKMIELYNTIYSSNFSTRTNCSSCIATCFKGIEKIYREYSGNN